MPFARHIPALLTTYRLLLGPAAIACAFEHASVLMYAVILITGTLSDIFDGVIARKLGVATPALRRYDSIVDLVYYLCIVATAIIVNRAEMESQALPICLVIVSEIACNAFSLIKFKRFPAAHSYLAKLFGLALFACFFALLVFGITDVVFVVAAAVGVVANIEIMCILHLSEVPPVDVKSIFMVLRKTRT